MNELGAYGMGDLRLGLSALIAKTITRDDGAAANGRAAIGLSATG